MGGEATLFGLITADLGTEWRIRAACRGMDPSLWFPDPTRPDHSTEAILVCRECPVRSSCATFAASTRQEFGVWGGRNRTARLATQGGRSVLAATLEDVSR